MAGSETTIVEQRPRRATELLRDPHLKFGQWVALGTILFLVFVEVLFPAPVGVLLQGAIDGAIAALTAIGIVLIYRANRFINFAYGSMGRWSPVGWCSLLVTACTCTTRATIQRGGVTASARP